MRRHKHSLSHYHLTTFDMGELVPVGLTEVLPGDTFNHRTSALVRVTPQLKPLMHQVQVRLHHFYVPNRLLWSGWEDFIIGNEGYDEIPTLDVSNQGVNTLSNYFGIPPQTPTPVSALPFRAYNMIFNEFYRDQDLVEEVDANSLAVQRISWAKDYFTAARPWPQKGPAVTVPIGDMATISGNAWAKARVVGRTAGNANTMDYINVQGTPSSITTPNITTGHFVGPIGTTSAVPVEFQLAETDIDTSGLTVNLSASTGVDIRDLREAFALQRYQEARARYGSRYVEYLRYLGIRPSDARLQRPEYLGGGKQTIAFSEVLNTSSGPSMDPLGSFSGHGISALRSNRYRRFFEEHGFVITLMSVRPRSIYGNGLHRKFTRATNEEYFQKELEAIGQQEVYNREVYAQHSLPDDIFGFTDRYRDYKEEPSRVSGLFQTTEDDWHMARLIESDVALNQSFITCNPTKRVFAEQTQPALYVMVNHNLQARRIVKRNPESRII